MRTLSEVSLIGLKFAKDRHLEIGCGTYEAGDMPAPMIGEAVLNDAERIRRIDGSVS